MNGWWFVLGALVFAALLFGWSARHPPKPITPDDLDDLPEPIPASHRIAGGVVGLFAGLLGAFVAEIAGLRGTETLYRACIVPAVMLGGYRPHLFLDPLARLWARARRK